MPEIAVPDPRRFVELAMASWRRTLVVLLGLLLAGVAGAGELSLADADMYSLSRAVHILEDADGKLTLADVRRPDMQARFAPVAPFGPGPNFGITRSAYWLQVTLLPARDAAPAWMLEVAYPPLDRIELYTPDGARQLGGDHQPFAARAVAHRNHVFPVTLQPGVPATLYLRVSSEGTVSAPLRLWRPAALWQHDQATYAGLGLYFGLLGGLLLYNLLLFVSVRDQAYLVYVGFAGAMGIAQAALHGFGVQFLWPGLTSWNEVSVPVGLTTSAMCGLQFARLFLSSAVRMPWLDRMLQVQIGGWGLSFAAALLLPYSVSAYMVTTLALVSVATMVVLGAISIRRGYPGARYFFTAWALLLVGVAIMALYNTGALPSNAVTANALLIGSALEMLLLSFALGDRINVSRRFKQQAQSRIAAERAMVEALGESKRRLRQVLREREVVLENSIVGIAFLTPQGRFKWANRAMYEIIGAQDGAASSMEPFYLSRAEYLQVGAEVTQAVARGEVYERELQLRRADGTLIWVMLSGKSAGPRNLSQGTVWVVRDITGSKTTVKTTAALP